MDVSASAYLSDYPKQAVDWLLFLLPQVERVYKDNPRSVAWRRAHIENSLGFALYMESNGLDNLEKAKRLEEAKVHLERALESHEHIFGTDDWRITDNLNNLGNVCRDSKELVRAKELLTRALTIREARYGVDHPEVAETLDGLGKTYIDLGKLETAKQMLTRSLIIKQNHYDAENRELAKTYHYQGKADLALGNTTAARESLQKALQIRLQHYDASHWLVIKIQQDLDAFQCKQ